MIRYLTACALTVAIETGFFLLLGWRDRDRIAAVVCANVVSNLLLNLCLSRWVPFNAWTVALGELLVVVFEYAVYARLCGRSGRLALLTLLAMHLTEYFVIGRKVAAEHGLSRQEGLAQCLAFGYTWWLPLKRGN